MAVKEFKKEIHSCRFSNNSAVSSFGNTLMCELLVNSLL